MAPVVKIMWIKKQIHQERWDLGDPDTVWELGELLGVDQQFLDELTSDQLTEAVTQAAEQLDDHPDTAVQVRLAQLSVPGNCFEVDPADCAEVIEVEVSR